MGIGGLSLARKLGRTLHAADLRKPNEDREHVS
jgi:hypothetical protein